MPKPADDVPYMQAMWNYGQAMAAVRQGRIDDAKQFHAALVPATTNPDIEKMLAWDRYSLIGGVQVAERFVAAEIARAEKDYDAAIAALNTAVTIEDTLPYDEPPAWNWPSRLALGNVLLEAGKPAEAEQAFRDELARNPENGWSLHGLAQALKAQGKKRRRRKRSERFAKAWANADVDLGRSSARRPKDAARSAASASGRAAPKNSRRAALRGRSALTPPSGPRCIRRRRRGSRPGRGRAPREAFDFARERRSRRRGRVEVREVARDRPRACRARGPRSRTGTAGRRARRAGRVPPWSRASSGRRPGSA